MQHPGNCASPWDMVVRTWTRCGQHPWSCTPTWRMMAWISFVISFSGLSSTGLHARGECIIVVGRGLFVSRGECFVLGMGRDRHSGECTLGQGRRQ